MVGRWGRGYEPIYTIAFKTYAAPGEIEFCQASWGTISLTLVFLGETLTCGEARYKLLVYIKKTLLASRIGQR